MPPNLLDHASCDVRKETAIYKAVVGDEKNCGSTHSVHACSIALLI